MPKVQNVRIISEAPHKEKGFRRSQKEWEKTIAGHIGRLIDRTSPEEWARLAVFGVGTIVCHNLNLAGMISFFGKSNDLVPTGLPYPFDERIRFPWETQEKPTTEDKITEWGIPLLMSWMLVYHPEAIAKFVDAMIPF